MSPTKKPKGKRTALARFTPVFDGMVQAAGTLRALVYGRVWLYCQGDNTTFYASNHRIAQELGLGVSTVNRALKTLTAQGYLKDLTPGRRLAPHHYRLTPKFNARPDDPTPADPAEPAEPDNIGL